MFESDAAKHKAHKARLAQYEAILARSLTPAQRDFVERRVEEEHIALRDLDGSVPRETTKPK